jgi:hypothetical protein
VHYSTPEAKQFTIEWCHKGSLHHLKDVVAQLSDGKIMACMFWNSEGVIHVDFLPRFVTLIHSIRVIALQCCESSNSEEKTWETVKDDHPTA